MGHRNQNHKRRNQNSRTRFLMTMMMMPSSSNESFHENHQNPIQANDKEHLHPLSSSHNHNDESHHPNNNKPAQQCGCPPPRRSSRVWLCVTLLVHLFGCLLYIIPLTMHPYEMNHPVLDESHVCNADNADVNGPLSFYEILQHDYWGRPMTADNSHRSWRPFTILSFRYLGGGGGRPLSNQYPLTSYAHRRITTLTLHRLVNVLLHAATADLVAILATRLFSSPVINYHSWSSSSSSSSSLLLSSSPFSMYYFSYCLYVVTKLLFLLHPTHVEVTANAANRNHLLATMFSLLLCDLPRHSSNNNNNKKRNLCYTLFIVVCQMPFLLLLGFASSETFLFQIPAILVTTTVMEYVIQHQEQHQERQKPNLSLSSESHTTDTGSASPKPVTKTSSFRLLLRALFALRWRHFVLVLGVLSYVSGRYYFNTLTIPKGLLRPAENPFAHFTGWSRVWNYVYVVALHLMKGIGYDVIGFSHEYGERCIEPLDLVEFQLSSMSIISTKTTRPQNVGGDKILLPADVRFLLPTVWFVLIIMLTMFCIRLALPTTTKVKSIIISQEHQLNETPNVDDDVTADAQEHDGGQSIGSDDQHHLHHHQQQQTKKMTLDKIDGNMFPLLIWCMHLSWLITLFPIAGIVKVGTFISDRIVVPSTVSVCVILGAFVTKMIEYVYNYCYGYTTTITNKEDVQGNIQHCKAHQSHRRFSPKGLLGILVFWFLYMWMRVHLRSLEWMESFPLLQSSLRSCPNFAKGHLEISKVYSGLSPEHFNLTEARWHLDRVEQIDPTYCDVHQQFAHVALQELQYVEFEERLVQALLCPFSMGGALEIWRRYWQVVLGPGTPPLQRELARVRHDKYSQQINEAVAKHQQEEQEE